MDTAERRIEASAVWASRQQWEEQVRSTYAGLTMSMQRGSDFFARMRLVGFGRLQVSEVESGPVSYERSDELVADVPSDHLLLSVKYSGNGAVEQFGRRAQAGRGDILLYDTSAPYRLEFPDTYREVVVKIPRSSLVSRVATPERFSAIRLDGNSAVARLVSRYLRELSMEAEALPVAARDRLDSAILDIVAVGLTNVEGVPAISDSAGHLSRAKTFMRAHASDSSLTAGRIAAALNISVRTLNRAFASENESAMKWLLDHRLEVAHTALAEGRNRSVSDTAFELGFSDLSHFSRSFKSKYDVTPSEVHHRRSAEIR
ncbi:helix-turn-helix domain-containing protein [Brevibacterium oceani]|uniref:AraC-like ligand-binding domain-containing protein n=1 Tax=Brevibacterium oceani TaxID=358099 RepID=UPI001B3224B4|nr:helix-turn-helix domain-containing protein [Brevibacterium oceani]